MWSYAIRRILVAIVLVWVVATIVFSILYLIPGDPAELLSSSGGMLPPPEAVAAMRAEMGLDRPILDQYGAFLAGILRGDLGRSFQDGYPISAEIATRLPRTIELILAATLLALAIGLPLGAVAARRQGGALDRVLSALASLQLSMPVFVIGTLLILLFAQTLRWVPAGGYVAFAQDPVRHLVHLSMPAFTIAVGLSATVFRMARASIIETLGRDWVRTARAKGLSRGRVMRAHVVRNALGPVATVVGLSVGTLLGGTVLIEYVFNWPGLSGFLVSAVEQRDYPAVRGIVLVISFLFILINLGVDLLYALLDPRIRHG
ncbi:MAG: ABC transporter permease [Pseudomonadota bacterium]